MNASPEAATLRLDADHRYWLGRDELWGVSAVLNDNRFVDPQWFDETSRSRGTAVHAILAGHARGLSYDPDLLDADLAGWVKSGVDFIAMLRADGAEIVAVESMRHHQQYRFAGTIDLIVRWRGYTWILDFKTGKAAKATRFQLGAYSLLVPPEQRAIKKAAVELDRAGVRPNLREYNGTEHFNDGFRFLSFLTTSRDRREFAPKEKSNA